MRKGLMGRGREAGEKEKGRRYRLKKGDLLGSSTSSSINTAALLLKSWTIKSSGGRKVNGRRSKLPNTTSGKKTEKYSWISVLVVGKRSEG